MIRAMPREPLYNNGLNDSGGDIDAYLIVSGGPSSIDIAAGVTAIPYGVSARDIPEDTQGDVQTSGWAPVLAGTAGMTEGELIMPEAGGTGFGVDATASAGDNVGILGTCMQTASSGKIGLVKIAISSKQFPD